MKIPKIRETQAARELTEGSVVVVDCTSGNYRLLNTSGSFLWGLIDGKRSVEDLAGALADNFDLSTDQALDDTNTFFSEMTQREIIQWHNKP